MKERNYTWDIMIGKEIEHFNPCVTLVKNCRPLAGQSQSHDLPEIAKGKLNIPAAFNTILLLWLNFGQPNINKKNDSEINVA